MEVLLGFIPEIIGGIGSVVFGANVVTSNMDSKQDGKVAQAIMTILNYLSWNFGKNKNADA